MANVFEAGQIKVVISARELKYKKGDIVKVYKMVDGSKMHTANLEYTDIETMHDLYTPEEIEVLANANLLVRCQNIARAWDKPKASKIDSGIALALKGKELTDEQKAKVIAYLNKI